MTLVNNTERELSSIKCICIFKKGKVTNFQTELLSYLSNQGKKSDYEEENVKIRSERNEI